MASTRVKLQLLATWTAAQHVPAADVSGTTPGSVHYGIAPIGDYWAVAGFTPSARARAGGAEVMAQFQDGPWVFSRPVGGRWRLVTDSGGVLCPDEVPAALAAIWGIRDSAQCRPQPPATPSS